MRPNRFELRFLRSNLTWELLLLLILPVIVFSSSFLTDYLFHDDWRHAGVTPFHCGDPPMGWTFRTLGRPLASTIVCLNFSFIKGFGDSKAVHFAGLLIIGLMAIALNLYLRRARYPRGSAFFLSFAVAMLPAFLVFSFWLGASFIVFAVLFAIAAAYLTLVSITAVKKARTLNILATLFLVVGFLIYQGGAMLYPILIFAALLNNRHNFAYVVAVTLKGARNLIAACVLYGGWYFTSGHASVLREQNSRGQFFQGFGGGIIWFFNSVIPRAAQMWFPFTAWVATLTLVAVCLSLVAYLFDTGRLCVRRGTIIFAGFAGSILWAYSPILVSGFRVAAFRLLIPLSAAVLIFVWTAFDSRIRGIHNRRIAGLFVFLGAFGIGSYNYKILDSVVLPPIAGEFAEIKKFVACDHKGGALEYIITDKEKYITREEQLPFQTDEFFALSTDFSANIPTALVQLGKWTPGAPDKAVEVKPDDKSADPCGAWDALKATAPLKTPWAGVFN